MSPNALVRVGCEEDSWDGVPGLDKTTMQLDSGHARHINVRNQAGCATKNRRLPKINRGRERLDSESPRFHETRDSLAEPLVIIDY